MGSIVSCITPAYSHVLFLLPGDRPGPSGKRNCFSHLKERDRCEEEFGRVCLSGLYHSFGRRKCVYHTGKTIFPFLLSVQFGFVAFKSQSLSRYQGFNELCEHQLIKKWLVSNVSIGM